MAFTSLRLLALAAVVYLLVITAAGLACRLAGRDSWIRATDRASLGIVRRLLDGAVGVGFTASALGLAVLPVAAELRTVPAHVELAAPAGAATMSALPRLGGTATMAASAPGPMGTATMQGRRRRAPRSTSGHRRHRRHRDHDRHDRHPTEGRVAGPTAAPPGVATMTAADAPLVPEALGTATMAATEVSAPDLSPPVSEAAVPTSITAPADDVEPADAEAPAVEAQLPPTPSVAATTWTVEAGDHLWSIAERTLVADGSEPSEDEVAAYWLRVIDENRDVLADPDSPDLIFRGQVITLPARP